jgi:BirA family biotin operon repressor/biotin-[acetyl-CoA-carboxylase] ligase
LDVAHEVAAAGARAGTAILADEQVAGRGRQGRVWISPAGQGIWLAYLVRPTQPEEVPLLALRVGIGLSLALKRLGAPIRLKWPNDLMLGDRKLGGILCEARWTGSVPAWVAIGVGLNVHGPVPEGLRDSAAAIDSAVPGVTRLAVLDHIVPALGQLGHGSALSDAEASAFTDLDWLKGRLVTEPLRGKACGVSRDGTLLVETQDGCERVVGGTVVAA